MKWLSHFVQYKIGNVNNVIYWFQSNSLQTVLQPLGRCCGIQSGDVNSTIADTSVIFNYNTNNRCSIGGFKSTQVRPFYIYFRSDQIQCLSVHHRTDITGYAYM